jgi:2',3'-cyclic-nucleotide 2'-phosphodiesterase (5'-nucleotidase family)
MKKICIYHTNDLHSRFDKLAGIASYLKANRTKDDMYFDAGDLLDFSDPVVYGTAGKSGLKLIKDLQCDALCLGNNECFIGKDRLEVLLKDKEIPILSANLKLMDSNNILHLMTHIFIEKKGYKFLVIGVNPFFNRKIEESYNNFLNLFGLNSCNPVVEVKKIIKEHNIYDFVVLLSHSGIDVDRYLAENISELDIIVGGHSHTEINENILINNCIITQAGSCGDVLGKLDLYIEDGKILNFTNIIIKNNFKQDIKFLEILNEQIRIADKNLNKLIVETSDFEFGQDLINCSLMRFLCDSVKVEYGCELCIINNGIFTNNLDQKITKRKLLEACPSPLNPTRIVMSGLKIKEAYFKSKNKEISLSKISGPGFRGNVLGTLSYSSNIELLDDTIYINGAILLDKKNYDVLTSDFLQRGFGYDSFLTSEKNATFYPLFFYEIIEKYIQKL